MFYVEQSLKALLPDLDSAPILQKFEVLKEGYFKWNGVYNLSSIRDEKGFWEKHIIDSLCLAGYISKEIPAELKVFDIGSGGGFPGLVLATVLKNKVCMVEPINKKTGFIEHMILKLGLKNAEVLKSRYEEIKNIDDNFLLVSRALGGYKNLKAHFSKIKSDVCLIVMTTRALAEETGGKIEETQYALVQKETPTLLNGHTLLIL